MHRRAGRHRASRIRNCDDGRWPDLTNTKVNKEFVQPAAPVPDRGEAHLRDEFPRANRLRPVVASMERRRRCRVVRVAWQLPFKLGEGHDAAGDDGPVGRTICWQHAERTEGGRWAVILGIAEPQVCEGLPAERSYRTSPSP